MKFLRNLIASILGTLIAMGIAFFLFLIVVAALSETEVVKVSANSVLTLNIDVQVKDYAPKSEDPIEEILGLNDERMGLNEVLNAIENAKTDPNITGISVPSLRGSLGIAQLASIREKLQDFKDSGKFVYAYADVYDQKSYYLASVADSLFLNPFGEIGFSGLGSEVLFFKDLEDKSGVKLEVIRHGKYKSAVEPFLFNEMSDENREQIHAFLSSIWKEMLDDIAESRELSVEELNTIADNLSGRNASMALESKLVDAVVYQDIYNEKLKAAIGISEKKNVPNVSISDYISTGKGRLKGSGSDRIAVIYAQGDIIYGKGNEEFIGQELIIKALRKARKSSSVKAIVLRVDSPGGSALASELIWREIALTKEEIPVIVSMGNVAASGGYYIACNADRIFAAPTTITGSIGVFGVLPNIEKFADRIGINAEQVRTNSGAYYSVFEPMTEAFRTVTTEGIEKVYTTFLDRVAAGRSMTVEEVHEVAQGRVWSGAEAIDKGLVDELGTLEDAIAYAAELVGLESFRTRNYPSYDSDLEDMFKGFPFSRTSEELIEKEIGSENYKRYQKIKSLAGMRGVQARIPFLMEIN